MFISVENSRLFFALPNQIIIVKSQVIDFRYDLIKIKYFLIRFTNIIFEKAFVNNSLKIKNNN